MRYKKKNGNGYEVRSGSNEAFKYRVFGRFGVCVKKLRIPFPGIIDNLVTGKTMLPNLLHFSYDKIFQIFQNNLLIDPN
jgi:hypothetical protein